MDRIIRILNESAGALVLTQFSESVQKAKDSLEYIVAQFPFSFWNQSEIVQFETSCNLRSAGLVFKEVENPDDYGVDLFIELDIEPDFMFDLPEHVLNILRASQAKEDYVQEQIIYGDNYCLYKVATCYVETFDELDYVREFLDSMGIYEYKE